MKRKKISQELPVNEIFHSIQGEGFFSGSPCIFIRFQGCPVKCDFCDTSYAVPIYPKNHSTKKSENIFKKKKKNMQYYEFGIIELTEFVTSKIPYNQCSHIVLTGGEPYLYRIEPLIRNLQNRGYLVQVETSGCFAIIKPPGTWITLSPKKYFMTQNIAFADEIKLIVTDDTDYSILNRIPDDVLTYLQPQSRRKDMTKIAIEKVLEYNLYLSIQLHEYLNIE